MKLYIKAKRFAWHDTLLVRDEEDDVLFEIKSELISMGNKINISNPLNEKVVTIEENKLSKHPKYTISDEHEKLATVKKDKSWIGSDYEIGISKWRLSGDVEGNDYHIKKNFKTIATLKKKKLSMGETFILEVKDGIHPKLPLGIVAAVWAIQKEIEEAEK